MGCEVGEVILGLLAVAALVKVVVPPLMFRLGLLRLRVRVDDDPAGVRPRGEDPGFRERLEEFTALGFRPLGTTYETCWFITAYDWLWRSRPIRWVASPDGRTLVHFSRLIDDEPIRFSAVTILEGGELVRTTCPGTGPHQVPALENYHRVQLTGVDPAELLSRHQTEVAGFSAKRGRGVVAATLRDAAEVDAAIDRQILPRISQVNAEQIIKTTFGGPAAVTLLIRRVSEGTLAWSDVALAICIGAAVTEATVRFLVRGTHRKLVAATHVTKSGPPPIANVARVGEEPAPMPMPGMSRPARTALLWVTMIVSFAIFWQLLNHRGR
jgi:hypothetical protein